MKKLSYNFEWKCNINAIADRPPNQADTDVSGLSGGWAIVSLFVRWEKSYFRVTSSQLKTSTFYEYNFEP